MPRSFTCPRMLNNSSFQSIVGAGTSGAKRGVLAMNPRCVGELLGLRLVAASMAARRHKAACGAVQTVERL